MSEETPRYDQRRVLATGGMGKVWVAHDTVLDREVALKVLKDEFAGDEHFRARFAAEARHAARLQHPNVAAVLDYGELPPTDQHPDPRPYLVMELVDGQPLSNLLSEGRSMPPETAADIVAEAAAGIAAAHRAGIVHRDVKPGNLLVTRDGGVKVTDFGIARAADAVPMTMTGHIMGTPHYLSPEQAEGGVATPASDVYGLGIVLFECLAGHKPFSGDSPVVIAMQQVNEPLPPLPDDVPSWLRAVVEQATAKDPAARYSDAGELSAALASHGASGGSATSVLPAAAAAAGAGAAGTTSSTRVTSVREEEPGEKRKRGGPSATALVVIALLVLVPLLVWGMINAADDSPTEEPGVQQVEVDPDDYIGEPYDEAAADLEGKGLNPVRDERANPGGEEPEDVSAVDPSGTLDEGTTITLQVWGPEPTPTQQPGQGQSKGQGQGQGQGTGGGQTPSSPTEATSPSSPESTASTASSGGSSGGVLGG